MDSQELTDEQFISKLQSLASQEARFAAFAEIFARLDKRIRELEDWKDHEDTLNMEASEWN